MGLQLEWDAYERGMCERGSGCTHEQRIGAAVALSWVEPRIAERDAELERIRAWIEEMAGERHLLHGRLEDGFWNCTHAACKKASKFLRGLTRFYCKARTAGSAGGNVPADCDWPFCGCDPTATKVLEAIEESGRFVPVDRGASI